MEVDVRLIVLTILYAVIKAQDEGSKVDLTDKLLYHCTWCLRNLSSAACRLLDNGTMSCLRCKEQFLDGLLCGKCSVSLDSNHTELQQSCHTCVCNGSFDASQVNDCKHAVHSRCFFCQSNSSGLQCKHCMDSNSGDTSFRPDCDTERDNLETRKKTGFSTKEKIIVSVCSAFGVFCLATTGFLVYRHFKIRRHSIKKPFWTVELTNRNYDDLDFSLLDPITDVPLVYRTDIGEFDNEALLGSEKPQLVMEVDAGNAVS